MKNTDSPQETGKKEKYMPPRVESENIYEQNALACGKCRTASHRQHACMRLPATS